MTKAPQTKRPSPPDRDGDGKAGGSLPGNKTVDAAKGSDDGAAPEWTRNDAEILEDLQLMDEGWSGTVESLTVQTVASWTDADAKIAQEYAASIIGVAPEKRPPAPDFLQPFLISKAPAGDTAPAADAEQSSADAPSPAADAPEPRETGTGDAPSDGSGDPSSEADETQGDPADTFTPEEIAAGATPVAEQEGETEATAADVATQIADDDPLVTIETETAPIAVRLRQLQVLIGARRLYKSAEGYSANYGAPYIDEATVQGWVKAGLAIDVPSAGNAGGVRLTAEARNVATRLRLQQQAEAA